MLFLELPLVLVQDILEQVVILSPKFKPFKSLLRLREVNSETSRSI